MLSKKDGKELLGRPTVQRILLDHDSIEETLDALQFLLRERAVGSNCRVEVDLEVVFSSR